MLLLLIGKHWTKQKPFFLPVSVPPLLCVALFLCKIPGVVSSRRVWSRVIKGPVWRWKPASDWNWHFFSPHEVWAKWQHLSCVSWRATSKNKTHYCAKDRPDESRVDGQWLSQRERWIGWMLKQRTPWGHSKWKISEWLPNLVNTHVHAHYGWMISAKTVIVLNDIEILKHKFSLIWKKCVYWTVRTQWRCTVHAIIELKNVFLNINLNDN